MSSPGRNEPCACGSGRKTKRCCGQARGPSGEQLARAHLAALGKDAPWELVDLSDRMLDRLWESLSELPMLDPSLHARLPELTPVEVARMEHWVVHDDTEGVWDVVTAIADRTDTPQQRARLADALIALRDDGRLSRAEAAYAIFDLSRRPSRFLTASVIEAVAEFLGRDADGAEIAA